jgi:hypothetical protein
MVVASIGIMKGNSIDKNGKAKRQLITVDAVENCSSLLHLSCLAANCAGVNFGGLIGMPTF